MYLQYQLIESWWVLSAWNENDWRVHSVKLCELRIVIAETGRILFCPLCLQRSPWSACNQFLSLTPGPYSAAQYAANIQRPNTWGIGHAHCGGEHSPLLCNRSWVILAYESTEQREGDWFRSFVSIAARIPGHMLSVAWGGDSMDCCMEIPLQKWVSADEIPRYNANENSETCHREENLQDPQHAIKICAY